MTADDLVIHTGKAGARLDVRVVPRGSRSALEGVRGGSLLVRVTAPPVGGAANAALVEVLAGTFGIPRRDVVVVAGLTSRQKRVELRGLHQEAVRRRLSAILR